MPNWISSLLSLDGLAQAGWLEVVLFCGAVLWGLSIFSLATGFALERIFSDRRIYAPEIPAGQLQREALGTLRFLLMAPLAFGSALYLLPIASGEASSTLGFWVTFLVCWIGFDVFYWGLHRAMHSASLFRFHRYHHESKVTTPMTGYSMSTVESLGWLVGLVTPLVAIAAFMPISIEGWLFYMLYHVSGNIVGHARVEVLGKATQGRWLSWIAHPITFHAMHHARVRFHYGFGSTYMDRLMGTEYSDWRALHTRVLAKQPIERLSDRG